MHSPNPTKVSGLIKKAYDSATRNKWIEAAGFCREALKERYSIREEPAVASFTEFSAKCHFRAAFQARDRHQFQEMMSSSKETSEQVQISYKVAQQVGRSKRAEAEVQIAKFWLQSDLGERMELAASTVSLLNESLKAFVDSGELEEAGETQASLLVFYRDFINFSTDFQSLRKMFDEAMQIGRSAIDRLRKMKAGNALTRTLGMIVWLLSVEAEIVMPPSEFQSLADQTRNTFAELQKVAQKVGTPNSQSLVDQSAGHIAFDVAGDPARALRNYEVSLKTAISLGDSLEIGRLEWLCSQAAYWQGYSADDPGEKRRLFRKGEAHALNAISNLEIPFETSELAAAHAARATCLVELANSAEPDLQQRKDLLRTAVETASKGTLFELGTWGWNQAAHVLARATYFLSKLVGLEERIRLLRETLNAREKIAEVNDHLAPHFWTSVAALYHLALVRAEMAGFEEDPAKKKDLLDKASSEMELCIRRGEKWGINTGFLRRLAEHNEAYAEILLQIQALTKDRDLAQRGINAYELSSDRFTASKSNANAARVRWKIARVHDKTRSFQLASDEFKKAATNYRKAISDVPGSGSLFEDLGYYLDAWSVIETARLQHDEGEYLSASEYYSTAAKLLEESGEWAYLSPLFAARSHLEKGEGLSSEEKHSGAIQSFTKALDHFQEEGRLLEIKLQETNEIGQQQELDSWLEIARQRESYSLARLQLEEARAFDRKGDKTASAGKFRKSSETLTTLLERISDVQERAELEGLAKFCDGWAKMKEAEARASPELYSEAAESFLALRSTQTVGQLLYLALANAAICKALGAGVWFQQTREVQYYSEVKKQTEAAAGYFKEAGFKKTEAWTRATQRLYDSMIFITDAESERDPARKTELYHLAESHLEFAARLYGEAGFPTRREEALSNLERIREEKHVLVAPLEALSQIPTITAASLSMSPRGRGQPIGTQRFDEAYVVGDLNIPQKEIPLGSMSLLDLEIANVGKAPATLVKLQNALPEGFELIDKEDSEISPNGDLDLKGRNLDHLKTYSVKLQVRPVRKGTTELRPRLFYVDDSGTYKTFQFRPTTITVLDVGLPDKPIALASELIPGPLSLGGEFRFDTERSRQVFQALVREFLIDYMSKKLYVEKAGWRTLTRIVRETKIPRSAVYGPRGRNGPVLAELERRGFVESRIFPKERGRGGSVKRVRVAYDNAIVKRIVEQSVLENK